MLLLMVRKVTARLEKDNVMIPQIPRDRQTRNRDSVRHGHKDYIVKMLNCIASCSVPVINRFYFYYQRARRKFSKAEFKIGQYLLLRQAPFLKIN
jgi:hypothetical protein